MSIRVHSRFKLPERAADLAAATIDQGAVARVGHRMEPLLATGENTAGKTGASVPSVTSCKNPEDQAVGRSLRSGTQSAHPNPPAFFLLLCI
jgi:hypothetical protein